MYDGRSLSRGVLTGTGGAPLTETVVRARLPPRGGRAPVLLATIRLEVEVMVEQREDEDALDDAWDVEGD